MSQSVALAQNESLTNLQRKDSDEFTRVITKIQHENPLDHFEEEPEMTEKGCSHLPSSFSLENTDSKVINDLVEMDINYSKLQHELVSSRASDIFDNTGNGFYDTVNDWKLDLNVHSNTSSIKAV